MFPSRVNSTILVVGRWTHMSTLRQARHSLLFPLSHCLCCVKDPYRVQLNPTWQFLRAYSCTYHKYTQRISHQFKTEKKNNIQERAAWIDLFYPGKALNCSCFAPPGPCYVIDGPIRHASRGNQAAAVAKSASNFRKCGLTWLATKCDQQL